jgi:tyrosinase
MRLLTPFSFALLIAAALAAPVLDGDSNALTLLDQLSQEASDNALAALGNTTTKRTTECTLSNISVRKEWCVVNLPKKNLVSVISTNAD